MKHSFKLIISLLIFNFFFSNHTAEAQIWKKLKRKAENRIEKGVDDILDGKKKKNTKERPKEKENK